MTTLKLKFRASSVAMKQGTLFFQVIHGRVVRQISTKFRIYPHEWDADKCRVIQTDINTIERNHYLASLNYCLKTEELRIREIIECLQASGTKFTADDIVTQFLCMSKDDGFLTFIRKHIVHLLKVGKYSAAEKMQSTLNSFVNFYGEEELPFYKVNSELIEEYEAWLKRQGVCMNTVSFYMRRLRAVYNLAVERRLAVRQNPFKYVYTGIDKTVKRAVSLKTIKQIKDLNLIFCSQKDFARDVFLFSFYTRGMSFIDMAYLKWDNLNNGVLTYRRHKTNQQITIKWEKPMQDIVAKYASDASPYLLPIIKDSYGDTRKQYRNSMRLVNRWLKVIGKDIGLGMPLTTYVARHAWASIAQSKNVPIATISKALGHDSEKTTRIYLASLDTSAVDCANSQILQLLERYGSLRARVR